MDLKYKYWHFQATLSDKECNDIIKIGKEKLNNEGKKATVLDGELEEYRKSNVCWFNDQWLYDMLWPYLNVANKNAGWNFDFDVSEDIQFTSYDKGGFYNWHVDGGSDHNSVYNKDDTPFENYYGKIRKLSMSVNLSDKNDYDGGDLLFKVFDDKHEESIVKCEEANTRGTIIIFPSFVRHKVTPITRGEKYSLVMWTLGKPFK